jgi:RNA polymerase sigma factor (sigma-70 family)
MKKGIELEDTLLRLENNPRDEPAWNEMWGMIRMLGERYLRYKHRDFSSEDIDDILHEIAFKLHRLKGVFRRMLLSNSPEGYLMTMIKHAAIDHMRMRIRERKALAEIGIEQYLQQHQETLLKDEILIRRLKQELELLPPEKYEMLRLRFWGGLSIKQIARKLGRTYSSTAVQLFRLLQYLRRRLGVGSAL